VTCGWHSNPVVQSTVMFWYKPQNLVDAAVLSLWYIVV
jgi:hypothetical protein